MKYIRKLCHFSEYVSGIIGLLALLLVCYEVVGRYFAPQILTDWGSEVTVYAVIWAVFLSFGELALRNEHVSADFLVARLEGGAKRAYLIGTWCIGLAFSAALAWAGWKMVGFALMLGEVGDTSLHFPKAYYYLALPVGMLFQCLVYGASLVTRRHAAAETEEG
ncbi:TRAP transporter small permease [Rhizobium sp. PAMB 3182]